jgi:hypothetical protein
MDERGSNVRPRRTKFKADENITEQVIPKAANVRPKHKGLLTKSEGSVRTRSEIGDGKPILDIPYIKGVESKQAWLCDNSKLPEVM